jgi:tetratricopeptide (TPR) repeat protein
MRRRWEAFAMKWKPPFLIIVSFFLWGVSPRLRAQQSVPATLTPKQLQEERARVQMAEKHYEAAIETYQDLLKADPKNALFMNMIGIAYLDLSNYDQAKKYFVRSSKADKKYASAVNNLGMVYYHQKNFRGAIRSYLRAAAIDPDQAGTHSNLGFAYYNTDKFPEAAGEFQKALELDPSIFERNDRAGAIVQDRSVTNHGLFFFMMAKVYAQKGDANHCAAYLRKSIDEGYKDVGTAATDPAFKDVINDPVMQDVLLRIAPAEQKGAANHPGA